MSPKPVKVYRSFARSYAKKEPEPEKKGPKAMGKMFSKGLSEKISMMQVKLAH